MAEPTLTLHVGDVRAVLPTLAAESVDCCVTSPPYLGLRDYGHDQQIGLESSLSEYVDTLVDVFREVRRVLRPQATLWLNLGDSYNAYNGGAGPGSTMSKIQTEARPRLATGFGLQQKELKPKDLMGVPWRVAFALQADGWYLRSDIIWSKPNPMPESVTDRPTKAHEYVFLLSKRPTYYYDAAAIAEPARWYGPNGQPKAGPHATQMVARAGKNERTGDPRKVGFNGRWDDAVANGDAPLTRNKRSVWTIQTQQFAEAHFAVFPEALVEPCIIAGSPKGGVVLDPFFGSGTTGVVARRHGRNAVGIELNPEYAAMARTRCDNWWRSPTRAAETDPAQGSLLDLVPAPE